MSGSEPVVFVVDDDAAFLAGVERLLRALGYAVASFASASEFLAQRAPCAAGCVVADLDMPGMDGLALQAALAGSDAPLPVVFLTGRGDIPSTVRAMRSGAEDFLTKTAPKEALIDAIERALRRDAHERRDRVRRHELQARFERLSPREREVLMHVLRGRLNKQIAADLGIDERSVKRHRTSLMAKLEVRSVAELARLAAEVSAPSPKGR
jgi:FixJ family two-component response regulator